MAKAKTSERVADGYETRVVLESEIEQAEDLWSLTWSDWHRNYFRHELSTIYGAFRGKDLHAAVGVIDMQIRFGTNWAPCGGIACVAAAPGHRHRNLVKSLMTHALHDLQARKIPFSCLNTGMYPLYERMGYAVTHKLCEIEVSTAHLRQKAAKGDARNWRLLPLDRFEETLPLHDRLCREYNLAIRRSALRCRALLFTPGRRFQLFIHEDGYMLWDLDRCRDRKLFVLEFVHLSQAAYLDGLALLGQMDSQYDSATWYDRDFEFLLKGSVGDPVPTFKILPATLTRVVDVAAFAKLLPHSLDGLKIGDPLGVSGALRGDIGTGEIVQQVCGIFNESDERFPDYLHGLAATRPVFSIERF